MLVSTYFRNFYVYYTSHEAPTGRHQLQKGIVMGCLISPILSTHVLKMTGRAPHLCVDEKQTYWPIVSEPINPETSQLMGRRSRYCGVAGGMSWESLHD